jgi:hypothetical protein
LLPQSIGLGLKTTLAVMSVAIGIGSAFVAGQKPSEKK